MTNSFTTQLKRILKLSVTKEHLIIIKYSNTINITKKTVFIIQNRYNLCIMQLYFYLVGT